MVRFSSIMDKDVKMHLDELGEIVGDGSVDWVVSETRPKKGQKPADIPLISWVSEKCMRSIVSGLLGLYAEDATGSLKKVCIPSKLSYVSRVITVSFRVSNPLLRKLRVVLRI